MELIGIMADGEMRLSPSQASTKAQFLSSLKDGDIIKWTMTRHRNPKSNQQVKTHFGLLINTVLAKTSDEGIDTSKFLKLLVSEDLPDGVGLSKDFLHALFYLLCPIFTEEGRRVTLSKMDTEQASTWFEQCRNLLASRGIYVEDPNPRWKEKQNE